MRITLSADDPPIEVRMAEKNFLEMTDLEALAYIEGLRGQREMGERKARSPKNGGEKKEKPAKEGRGKGLVL